MFTLELILGIVIQSASVRIEMEQKRHQQIVFILEQINQIFADGGYFGKLIDMVKTQFNIELEIMKRSKLRYV